MRLENLYPNFGKASPEAQAEYIACYRLHRAEDMAKPSTYPKTKAATKSSRAKIVLTEEEETLMKLLGLKKKDMTSLRALAETEE